MIDLVSEPHGNDPQIDIDGAYVYKATALKGLFGAEILSHVIDSAEFKDFQKQSQPPQTLYSTLNLV